MDETRLAPQALAKGAPVSDTEEAQAAYAFRELSRSDSVPGALRMSHELLSTVQALFELGWALGVRTGHTGPALANVPVDRATIERAFRWISSWDHEVIRQRVGQPILWQKVRYSGSLTRRHGEYWVVAIHAYADPDGGGPELRYDLCEIVAGRVVPVANGVRPSSLEPLSGHRPF